MLSVLLNGRVLCSMGHKQPQAGNESNDASPRKAR